MDPDSHLRRPRSRRDLFRLAGVTTVGGSAIFLGACGGDDEEEGGRTDSRRGGGENDVNVLNSALDLENTAIAAYTVGGRLLTGEAAEFGKRFREQEQDHAEALSQAIRDLRGTPNRAKSIEEYTRGFPSLNDQDDVLNFAVDLENTAVAAYNDAIPKLSDGKLRQTAAAINTTEAEHIAVLLEALGRQPVPEAFVTGTSS